MSQEHDQAPKIHVISTSTVEVESTLTPISLTPWDLELLFAEPEEIGLVFVNPTLDQESAMLAKSGTTSLIDHLKASFQRTLHFFPPLTGRLASTTTDDGAASSFFIDCDHRDGGALFNHATVKDAGVNVADFITNRPEIVSSFFPLTGGRNIDGIHRPLLAIQVTELVDGLFIGWSINHSIVDGTSIWHFVNSWAEISRGEIEIGNPISKLPSLNRDKVNLDLVGSSSIHLAAEHLMLNKHPDQDLARSLRRQLKKKLFRFTKESIAKLKARANQEMVESEGKISSLQALVAHIWRSIIRCRVDTNSISVDQETTFDLPMNARPRLNPPLPGEYFGNAVFGGNLTLGVGDILENGIGWIAWRINRVVATNSDPDKVRQVCTSWMKNPTFNNFVNPPGNFFILAYSPRFDVYGNDFGWGKPVAARGGEANNCFDGRITVFGGLEEGSVEIDACLSAETLSTLEEDEEFMEYVA